MQRSKQLIFYFDLIWFDLRKMLQQIGITYSKSCYHSYVLKIFKTFKIFLCSKHLFFLRSPSHRHVTAWKFYAVCPSSHPERTATFWRDFSAIQSISVTAVKKRFWRQAILSPPAAQGRHQRAGRPAGTAQAGRRSANSWLSVLHAIPLVVQIVVGHLLSLVPTYVRLLVQRLSVVL